MSVSLLDNDLWIHYVMFECCDSCTKFLTVLERILTAAESTYSLDVNAFAAGV